MALVLDNFTYLGIRFTHTGNLSQSVKALSEQALKAYHNLLYVFDRVHLDVKTKLSLFDAMVVPILLYGSEVWGVYGYKEIDKLHIKFCKYILGVRQQTSNYAVYGELGRYPLSLIAKERSLKFWLKIMKNTNSPIYNMYIELNDIVNRNCWSNCIKNIIDSLGYSHVFNNVDFNTNYLPLFKRRMRDHFIQEWHTVIASSPKLDYYAKFKETFCYEDYLDKCKNEKFRKSFSRLRLSSHSLEIETGRYNGIDRMNRLCKLCNQNVVESEYHFLLCCTKYTDIRNKYLGHQSWPSLNKFNALMSTKNSKLLYKISKFIAEAFEIRTNALNDLIII